jgi:hypothetical protein
MCSSRRIRAARECAAEHGVGAQNRELGVFSRLEIVMRMKIMGFAFMALSFAGAAAGAEGKCQEFELESGHPMHVPTMEVWRIQGLKPYKSDTGVGTADLYVKGGYVTIGEYTVSGDLEISINKKQTRPIEIGPGATVVVGDSRGELTICILSH